MSTSGALNGLFKLAIAAVVIGGGALAVNAVLDHMTRDQRTAERRALLQRNAELNVRTLAPGSVLACLDGGAGETIETACEKSVFASPESAASAVAYTGARLALLADATEAAQREPSLAEAFVPARRAIELDRYGIVAHVLATRDGCTADNCAAFNLLRDTAALRANLKAQAFDNYVARYAEAWNKSQVVAEKAPQAPAQTLVPVARAPEPETHPVSTKYDFPSAASIPPVSIMNAEPALTKAATDTQAAQPKPDGEAGVPVPPKRPQAQAATPPAR
jgi:hypothetical protein